MKGSIKTVSDNDRITGLMDANEKKEKSARTQVLKRQMRYLIYGKVTLCDVKKTSKSSK